MSSVDTTEEVVGEVVSIEGVVKWFDPVKGYGFIVPNDGGVDVLVHHSTLRRGGYDILYPQARIKCTIIQRQQGFQADKIIAVDNSEAIIPTGMPFCLASRMCLISSRPRKYGSTVCAASVSLMSSQTGKIFSCTWKCCAKRGLKRWCPDNSCWFVLEPARRG